jgi:hypothetical protein
MPPSEAWLSYRLVSAVRATAAPSVAGTVPCLAEQVCRPGAIRTAQLANRDERARWRPISPDPGVSASDSRDRIAKTQQNCGNFSGHDCLDWKSLWSRSFNGGGGSRGNPKRLEIEARESIHRPILRRTNIENSQPQASVVSMDMSRTHATPCSLRPPRRPGDSTNISGSELELDPTLVR